ncbi:MAG: class I SAM-dependent methyltransferase [Candidatus Aminicenantes bacterium]|nr:class I SAM-dependent methyltransferase [Candidatus Aminicenantes bacterium]
MFKDMLKELSFLVGNPYFTSINKIKRYVGRGNEINMPPMFLRKRVHGARDIYSFLKVGKNCARDLTNSLKIIGRDWSNFSMVLDFGCGCARVLRHLKEHSKYCHFFGTDIDPETIFWCRNNIDYADFFKCNSLPPLKYPQETFDLLYGVSVFTHLNEEYQFLWLDELRRIAKKKAVLLMTVQGSLIPEIGNHCGSDLTPEEISILRSRQIFSRKPKLTDFFAAYESYRHTYHTKDYIYKKWSEYFKIVEYITRGLNNHHDVVVLEKK